MGAGVIVFDLEKERVGVELQLSERVAVGRVVPVSVTVLVLEGYPTDAQVGAIPPRKRIAMSMRGTTDGCCCLLGFIVVYYYVVVCGF